MANIIDILSTAVPTLARCAAEDAHARRFGTYDTLERAFPRGRRSYQARSARPRAIIRAAARLHRPTRLLVLAPEHRDLVFACNGLAVSEDAKPGRVLLDDLRAMLRGFLTN